MKFLTKLERKFGNLAIKNLMLYIVIANAITFAFSLSGVGNKLLSNLVLSPELVMQGQIWRVVTFLFLPPSYNIIFIVFALYFYYLIGSALENTWGTFKFNLYYLIGVISVIAGSFITGYPVTNEYLNLSLFLVFAHLFPDMQVNLYFLVPIKIKYLSFLYWFIIALSFIESPTLDSKLAIIFPLINFFLFFGKDIFRMITGKKRRHNYAKAVKKPIKINVNDKIPSKYTVHKCTTCGITEKDNPNMEFRFCSKCQGFHEYCIDHLKTHEHIKEN